MKLKNDFVTNSSSCSYIVCIPDMNKFVKQMEEYFEISQELKDVLYKSNEYIDLNCFAEDEDWNIDKFWDFHKVVNNLGYVVMYDECGSDNTPRYLNIGNKKSFEKLKKIVGEA